MLSETEVAFVSVVMMAIMNGIHLVTFILCLRWQIYTDVGQRTREGIKRRSMILATIFVFAFSVTNLGICLGSFLLGMQGNNDLVLTGVLTVRILASRSIIVIHNCL